MAPFYLKRLHPESGAREVSLQSGEVIGGIAWLEKKPHWEKQDQFGVAVVPKKFKERVANKAAKFAASKVKKEAIASGLSEYLPKLLMYKMYHEAGMKVAAQTVFVEDSFVVMVSRSHRGFVSIVCQPPDCRAVSEPVSHACNFRGRDEAQRQFALVLFGGRAATTSAVRRLHASNIEG